MIPIIVGRCHVGYSNRKVIRYVISCMRKKYKTWAAMPKANRKAIMREIIRCHAENRNLYHAVMTGRL